MSVRVFFDFTCPYCYLAREFLKKMQRELAVETEWVPWEIAPERPSEGAQIPEEKRAGSLERYRDLADDICRFEMMTLSPNTHNALLGLEFARSVGMADVYTDRFFKARFIEDINFSSVDAVVKLGAEAGLDERALRRSIEDKQYEDVLTELDSEAEGMGLEVVPSFVQDGKPVLAGSTTMKFDEFREKYLALWG